MHSEKLRIETELAAEEETNEAEVETESENATAAIDEDVAEFRECGGA